MAGQKERMLAGELYIADDPELAADLRRAMKLMERFNTAPAEDADGRRAILAELLGEVGRMWRPPVAVRGLRLPDQYRPDVRQFRGGHVGRGADPDRR